MRLFVGKPSNSSILNSGRTVNNNDNKNNNGLLATSTLHGSLCSK